MNIYLAGPMRGFREFNFPAFREAAEALRAEGHFVFSPADRDNARYGTDISAGNETGSEQLAAAVHGFSLREALAADTAWICATADAIAMLPGWQLSKGATAERVLAIALGLPVLSVYDVMRPKAPVYPAPDAAYATWEAMFERYVAEPKGDL